MGNLNCCEACTNDKEIITQNEIKNMRKINSTSRKEKLDLLATTAQSEDIKELKIKNLQLEKINQQLQQSNQDLRNKNQKLKQNNQLLQNNSQKLKEENEILKNNNSKVNIIKKTKGLDNIGATCYMNATLQCLSNTKKLSAYFLNNYNLAQNNIMSNEFYKLNLNLYNEKDSKKSFSPYSFKEELSKANPLFAGIQANDSKDLINFLLEKFHQELNVVKNNNINNYEVQQEDQTKEALMFQLFLQEFSQKFNSPISNLFYGVLETKSQCKGCNIIKYNFQIYSFIEFPLQQVNQYFYQLGRKPLVLPNNKNPDVNLFECFEYHRKPELMVGDNQMWCNICNKLCDSFYSTNLYSAPNYLIINLNRGKGAVYECNVNFPEQLNLFNYLAFNSEKCVFDLYAVICHLGPSSMSGHFVAYIRNSSDYKWYLYNDAIVTECTRPKQYNDGMPYILFYKVIQGGANQPY